MYIYTNFNVYNLKYIVVYIEQTNKFLIWNEFEIRYINITKGVYKQI